MKLPQSTVDLYCEIRGAYLTENQIEIKAEISTT